MKLKPLLQKLLAKEGSGKSVFFAFTLWIVGLYFLASVFFIIFHLLLLSAPYIFVNCFLSIAAVLTLNFIVQFGWFYHRQSKPRRWLHRLFWPTVILLPLVMIGAIVGTDIGVIIFAVPGFFIFLFLMLLLLPKVRWYYALGNVLSWAGCLFIAFAMTAITSAYDRRIEKLGAYHSDGFEHLYPGYYDRIFYNSTLLSEFPLDWLWSIPRFFHFSGNDWLWSMLLGVALFAAGYLLLAKIFADAEAIPFRRMFGKGVFLLWGLAAGFYLTFVVWSLVINRQTAQDIRQLEQRFGRPITVAALGAQYYNRDQPDMEFWRHLTEISQKDLAINQKVKFNENPLDEMLPEQLALCRQKFALIAPGLKQWEQTFTARTTAPPWERQYLPGKEYEMVFYAAKLVSWFGFDETWQLRLALEDHNIDLAFQSWERINTVNEILLRENNWPSISIWIICQNRQLDALQRLLESGLTSTQLETVTARLSQIELQVPIMQESSIYGEIVADLDHYDRIGYGYRERADLPSSLPVYYIQWVLPQCGTFFASAKHKDMRYLVEKYVNTLENRKNPRYYYSDRYDALTARLRAAKVVIRAIEYKQQHGRYPETLDNLPLDLFTGKPMQYHAGEWQIVQTHFTPSKDWWSTQRQLDTVPAVISWSVGPDHKDNQGRSWQPDTSKQDDAAFIVRINP